MDIDFEEAKREWIKLGYTDEDATKLTNIALSVSEVGIRFESLEDATKWLIEATKSSLESYRNDLEKAYEIIGVVDKLSEISCINPIPYESIKVAIDRVKLSK